MTDAAGSRLSWDEYFLGIARAVGARADCRRGRFGAVIVDAQHRIVSTGYNGSPPGGPSCLAGECPRGLLSQQERPGHRDGGHDFSDCVALHAEQNAVVYGDQARMQGGTIYVTDGNGEREAQCCDMCSKLVLAAGIERVVTG